MDAKFYKEKTEKMLEDLLEKIHQDIQAAGKTSMTDIELLHELNDMYFKLNKN